MGLLMQNVRPELVLVSEGCAGIPSTQGSPLLVTPRLCSSACKLSAVAREWECVCQCFLSPRAARSCAGACAGLAARLGAHPSRAGVTAHRLGWSPWDGVSGTVDPALAARSCWEDAPGRRTVPKFCWDMRLRGCLGSRLARWLHPQLPGDGNAWLGWRRWGGQGTSRRLPGQGKSAPVQHWQKALGLVGAGSGHEGVGGAGPWQGDDLWQEIPGRGEVSS